MFALPLPRLLPIAAATVAILFPPASLVAQAQPTWIQRTPPGPSPSPRLGHRIAYDEIRGKTVLFGGVLENGLASNETWTWDGTSWTLMPTPGAPFWRLYHTMTWDPVRGKVIMFGGLTTFYTLLHDMWAWDGTSWTEIQVTTRPDARAGHTMAFDAARGVLVMYGGKIDGVLANDLWEWNGIDWTKRNPAHTPPVPGQFGGFDYDPIRQKTVLFGGWGGSNVSSNTVEWDGTDWTLRSPATSPSRRALGAMAYYPPRGTSVLFGGAVDLGIAVAETWEWDGTNWGQLVPSLSPPARLHSVSAYDKARRCLVLFGGHTGSAYLNDTWEYSNRALATYQSMGTGCAGSNGVPVLQAVGRPVLGASYQVNLSKGAPSALAVLLTGNSKTTYVGLTLPLALPGAPLCNLLVSGNLQVPLQLTPQGTASVTLPLQNNPSWIGLGVFNQFLIIDPGSNPLGLAVSQAGEGRVGEF